MSIDSNKITGLFNLYSADVQGISRDIAPKDNMRNGGEKHYFAVGQSALRVIKAALVSAEVHPKNVRKILDFPCGYGRVLRGLTVMFPNADITGADVLREGVDFCAETFGSTGVYANVDIHQSELDNEFDLIWCGSLLTHLHLRQWCQLIRLFRNALAPEGLMVLTVHGRRVIDRLVAGKDYGLGQARTERMLTAVGELGFAYEDYPGQENYGISVSKPSWVLEFLGGFPRLQIVHYNEAAWDDHQDVVVCRKTES